MIQKILEDRVATIVGLPTFQRENTRIERVAGQPWCRYTHLPAKTKQETIGVAGINRLIGLGQVDLFFPADQGTAASGLMAQAVLDAFPRGLQLTNGTETVVIEISYLEAGQRVDQYYQVPVVLQYRAHS